MEQVAFGYEYEGKIYDSADRLYVAIRDRYYEELGKRVYRRLDVSARRERVHGFHAYYEKEYADKLEKEFSGHDIQVPVYLLGLTGVSYCYSFNTEDCPDYEEEKFFRWIDWALMNYGTVLKLKNRKSGTGRTSKRLKARYR